MSAPAILVLAALVDGEPAAATLELLGTACGLAGALGAAVTVLAPGAAAEADAALVAAGADTVLHAADSVAGDYDNEAWTACAAHAARETAAQVVLVTHDARGAELAPRLAFRLDGSVATGCLSLRVDGAALVATRACYGGNAQETVALARVPAVASMRKGTAEMPAPDTARTGAVRVLDWVPPPPRTRVLENHRDAAEDVRLEDARIVVAGGRGLDGPEGFDVLRGLARELGAAVGASRVPCDLGWCPHSMQIGLTGKTVTPDLYVAVGISGAGHHLAGCGGAKTIVAINTDADAPIFRQARFGVVGDYRKLVPALTRALARVREEAGK